jgi:hypothetical protein
VRVLTLNLWGRRGDWEARRAVIAEGLRKLEPDLIAFQEAVVEGGYDQTAELLGPGFHYAHQAEPRTGRRWRLSGGREPRSQAAGSSTSCAS